jgi:formylglycine-generating enzyme required for sulfatase activity
MSRKTIWLAALLLAAAGAQAQQTGAAGIQLVRVPGGCYPMGSETGEKHERPVRNICVKDFEIGRTEVTQGQWLAVMGSNPSRFQGESNPVEMVSWNDAQEFLRRVNAMNAGTYRLPTEAEWEYACRSGGKAEDFAGVTTAPEVGEIAWYNKGEAGNMTHPVGTKKPNGLGLHDMSGNVWEWVQDFFVTPYGGDRPETRRVLRGGSWDGKVNYVRCQIRNRNDPDRRDPRLGLRVVRDVR